MSRILLGSWDGEGGATEVVHQLKSGLSDLGHHVDVVYQSLNSQRKPTPPRVVTAAGEKREFSDIGSFVDFVSGNGNNTYDAVHFHNTTLTKRDLELVANINSGPLLYTVHSVIPHSLLNHPSQYWMNVRSDLESSDPSRVADARRKIRMKSAFQERIIDNADKVIVTTNFVGQQVSDFYPGARKKTIKIPHGTDFMKYIKDPDVIRRAGLLARRIGNDPIILYVGRLSKEKGVQDLAAAYNIVRQTHNANLVVVGEGNTNLLSGIDSRFRGDFFNEGWIKDKADIAAYYALARRNFGMLVIPSYYESFSLATIDSLAMGVPVVISDVDGPHELFIAQKPQLAYPSRPADVTRITKCINKILDKREAVARRIRASVSPIVTKRFSLDRVIQDHMKAYGLPVNGSSPTKVNGRLDSRSNAYVDDSVRSVMDKSVEGPYELDTSLKTWSGKLYFFQTPNFKHEGVVVKQAVASSKSRTILKTEANVLRTAQAHMSKGKYKVPNLVVFDQDQHILIQERISGQDALQSLINGTKTLDQVLIDAGLWTDAFQGNAVESNLRFCETKVYEKFMKRIAIETAKRNDFPDKSNQIRNLLEHKWKTHSYRSNFGIITGDFSPIHLFYQNASVYGIDFNAAQAGSRSEELGLFLGNLMYHLRENGFNQNEALGHIKEYLDSGGFEGNSPTLCPVIAMSYYAKGTAERNNMVRKRQFFEAALRLLNADTFRVGLLKYR